MVEGDSCPSCRNGFALRDTADFFAVDSAAVYVESVNGARAELVVDSSAVLRDETVVADCDARVFVFGTDFTLCGNNAVVQVESKFAVSVDSVRYRQRCNGFRFGRRVGRFGSRFDVFAIFVFGFQARLQAADGELLTARLRLIHEIADFVACKLGFVGFGDFNQAGSRAHDCKLVRAFFAVDCFPGVVDGFDRRDVVVQCKRESLLVGRGFAVDFDIRQTNRERFGC